MTSRLVYALAVSGANLFAGTWQGGVFLSTDNGNNWEPVNSGITSNTVKCFAVSDSGLFAGTIDAGIFLSKDNGASWKAVNNGLANLSIQSLAVSGSNLFAGTMGSGVFLSTNSGANWKSFNEGSINNSIYNLTISDTNLYASTGNGVWRRSLLEIATGVKGGQNDMPQKYLLLQNYPNPFNPITIIKYSVSKTSFVTIKVYDILGREIKTLVNSEKLWGDYEIKFDGSNLTSGIYIYRMHAGNFVETKKLLLLK